MRYFVLVFIFISSLYIQTYGQEGLYYYGSNSKPVKLREDAVTYKEVKKRSEKKYTIETHRKLEEKWILTNKEKIKFQGEGSQTIFYNSSNFLPKRIYREMEKSGGGTYSFKESTLANTLRTGNSTRLLPLHLEGMVTEYHPNGKVKSESLYRDNQLISNENWLPDGSKYIDSVFYSVDKEPEYQMGDEFFNAFLLRKLEESKLDLSQIEDQVVIGWVIMETGQIDGAIALKGKSRQLNEILVNTITELPGYWTPAILDGSPVRYFMSIPLYFMQRDADFQDITFSGGVMHFTRY